jgi:hypothetical protein
MGLTPLHFPTPPRLLRLAHHGQQRVRIGLLIAGEQRLGVLPGAGRGDVLEGVMLSVDIKAVLKAEGT